MSFAEQIDGYLNKYIDQARTAMTGAVVDTCEKIILRTPVATGRSRANWQATTGTTSDSSVVWTNIDNAGDYGLEAPAPSPGSDYSIERMIPVAEEAPGKVFSMVNNVIYTEDLEYGSSGQAPNGMMRVTTAEWQQTVEENINKAK